jgi:hypothetical protein
MRRYEHGEVVVVRLPFEGAHAPLVGVHLFDVGEARQVDASVREQGLDEAGRACDRECPLDGGEERDLSAVADTSATQCFVDQ